MSGRENTSYALTAAVMLAIAAVAVFSWFRLQIATQNLVEDELSTILDISHRAVEAWADGHQHAVELWADSAEVTSFTQRLLEIDPSQEALLLDPAQSAAREFFAPILASRFYRGYFLIGRDGLSLSSTRDANVGTPNLVLAQPKFLESIWNAEPAITTPMRSDEPLVNENGVLVADQATMFVGAPVRDAEGEIVAALTLRLDPAQDFTAILQRGRVGESGETYAFDGEGRFITESRFDDQLRAIGLLDTDQYAILNLSVVDPGVNLVAGEDGALPVDERPLTRMASEAIDMRDGVDLGGYRDYRGVDVIGAWLWDDSLRLGIASEQDVAEAYGVLRSNKLAIFGVTMFVEILILGGAIALVHNRRQLVDTGERYRELFDTAGDAIITVDSEQGIVLFNKRAEAMFGYQVDEVIGRPQGMLLPADERGVHEEHVKHFAGGDVDRRLMGQRGTLSGLRSDGVMFPAEITISKRQVRGEFEFTSVVRDITERKEMEDAVDAYAKKLGRSNEELKEYATLAAHDLQEPLRKIEIFADKIVTNSVADLSEKSLDDLERLVRSVQRMRALVGDLLSYAHASARSRNLESVDLETLAGEVVIDLQYQIEKTGGSVHVEHLPVIEADPIQMSQLLRNLIDNGLKFHQPDIPPMVTVEGQVVDNEHTGGPRICRFTVRDNGIGFDEKHADQIFSMFQRLHGISEYPGTGIGLALCHRIAEHHSGEITATSTPGEGSTFTVNLPVTHDPEPDTPPTTVGTRQPPTYPTTHSAQTPTFVPSRTSIETSLVEGDATTT